MSEIDSGKIADTLEETQAVSRENFFEIDSPPLIDLGYLPSKLLKRLIGLASRVAENPGYAERGRLSRLIGLQQVTPDTEDLAEFANSISGAFLGSQPGTGSSALLSVVTDEEAFKRYTEMDKAASSWHQDFDTTPTGIYFPPDSRTRLVIPLSVGTIYATGRLLFDDVVQIGARREITRSEMLNAGRTIIGADGVLIKSELDPIGGTIHVAEPAKVYVIPKRSTHKSPPLPNGRIFFQLDSFS